MKNARVTLSTFERESLKAAVGIIEGLRVEERAAMIALDTIIDYQSRLAQRYKSSPVMFETLSAPIENFKCWREALANGSCTLDRLKEMVASLPI